MKKLTVRKSRQPDLAAEILHEAGKTSSRNTIGYLGRDFLLSLHQEGKVKGIRRVLV